MTELAQDSGGSLLPDWLADAPPWLQALALVGALIGALALATATVWAPALADRIRGRTSPASGSTAAPADSATMMTPTGSPSVPAQEADAKMQLIDRMVLGLEKNLADADRKVEELQEDLARVRTQLAAAREEIARLTWQRDRLLEQRLPPTTLPPPGRSPEH